MKTFSHIKFAFLALSLFSFSLWAQEIPLSQIVNQTQGLAGEKNVEILIGETAYIDKSIDVGTLTINGTLVCRENAEIKANTIYVNGLLQCGTLTTPFAKKLTISLEHQAIDPKTNSSYRGLIVRNPGKLLLFGDTKRSGHLKLSATALKGAMTAQVNADVSKWVVGDEVVIASSTYNPDEAETLLVQSVSGNKVNFTTSLKFNHWGQTENLSTQIGTVVLDQRAEIANLTRNIVIRADESKGIISELDIADSQLGGHVMVMKGATAQVDSVEFYHMGHAGIMARYPFHWHLAGDVPGQYIKNSSIHRSYQRCITIHQSNKALVENNVCYDFRGHGFFLEDGNEIDNVITKNLGIRARVPLTSKILLASDNPVESKSGVTPSRFAATSVFWISHPQNTVTHNIAAGSEGTGFWMAFTDLIKAFDSVTGKFDGQLLARPQQINTTNFSYNVAHSSKVGHTWDGAPNHSDSSNMQNPNNPQDRKVVSTHYRPWAAPVFTGLVAYKNILTGIYFRGHSAIFDKTVMADNGTSLFLAYNQIIKNSVIVARSNNHSQVDDDYLYDEIEDRYRKPQKGILLYDGPWELDTVDFINFLPADQSNRAYGGVFDVTSIPLLAIGGAAKFTNISKKIKMSPEPAHRLSIYDLEANSVWYDETFTNSLRDVDGSLTGIANQLILPVAAIANHPLCEQQNIPGKSKSFNGFVICPSTVNTVTLNFSNKKTTDKIPFVVLRNGDSKISMPKGNWDYLDSIGNTSHPMGNRKTLLVSDPSYSYQVMFKPEARTDGDRLDTLQMHINAEKKNTLLPITKIIGLGSDCSIGATKYNSVPELQSATGDGYFSSGNDFYIKLKASELFENIIPNSGMSTESTSVRYRVTCTSPIVNTVTGRIDSITTIGSDTFIKGWACDYGKSNTIAVHFYARGPANLGGVNIGQTNADLNSEEPVNFACADASKNGHRFSYKITGFAGQKIYAHGISSSGKSNLLISKSGDFSVPGDRATNVKYSCLLNGEVLAHGAKKLVYKNPMVAKGLSCESENRECNDGVLTGSYNYASCTVNANAIAEIKGYLNVSKSGLIQGWACQKNNPKPIQVNIYAEDPLSGGKLLKTLLTFEKGDPAVGTACGTKDINHKFTYQLDEKMMLENQGKTIFVTGVSGSSAPLGVAGDKILPVHTIIGNIDAIIPLNGLANISGWACYSGKESIIELHFYAGGPAATGTFVGSTRANQNSSDYESKAEDCGDEAKNPHRFSYIFPSAIINAHPGKAIYVYGISPISGGNKQITNSGMVKLP
jgi:hypothetical protein